jgi:hypothetical protein
MGYIATALVAFGLGVGFSNKVKAGFAALFTKAKADAAAEVAKGVADVKAKL